MSKKYKDKICVYCTEMNSSEGDHIFSRKFFLPNRRDSLPKVPACKSCNNKKSQLETDLTAILPFSGKHSDARENLVTMVPPRLRRNAKLHGAISTNFKTRWRLNNGLILPHAEIPFDYDKMKALMSYVLRGAAACYFDTIVSSDYFVDSFIPNAQIEWSMTHMLGLFNVAPKSNVKKDYGNGTILLEGVQSESEPNASAWKVCIYGGLTLINDELQQQGAPWMYGLIMPSRPENWNLVEGKRGQAPL